MFEATKREWIVIYDDEHLDDRSHFYIEKLTAGFENRGYAVYIYDTTEDSSEMLKALDGEHIRLCIGLEGAGVGLRCADGRSVQELLAAPYCGVFSKHPAYYHEKLREPLKDYYVFCSDEKHVAYIKKVYPHINHVSVIQLAGCMQSQKEAVHEKKYAVVCVEDYQHPERILDCIDRVGDKNLINVLYSVIETMFNDLALTVEEAFDAVLTNNCIVLERKDYAEAMQIMLLAEEYVHNYIKGIVLKSLTEQGVEVTVFGKGWEALEGRNSCLKIETLLPYQEIEKVIGESAVVLQILSDGKYGGYDTVLLAAKQGAVCVSDNSSGLSTCIYGTENGKFCTFSLKKLYELPVRIRSLLGDFDRRSVLCEEAYNMLVRSYTEEQIVQCFLRTKIEQKEQEGQKKMTSYATEQGEVVVSKADTPEKLVQDLIRFGEKLASSDNNKLYYNEFQMLADRFIRLYNEVGEPLVVLLEEQRPDHYLLMSVYSALVKRSGEKIYIDKMLDMVMNGDDDAKIRLTVYWYITEIFFKNGHKADKETLVRLMQLYFDVADRVKGECSLTFPYRRKEDRDANKVIVITSQFLDMRHGPTKTALDRCECLIKQFGMQVFLINTGDLLFHDDRICFYDMGTGNYVEDYVNMSSVDYNGCRIPFYQCKKGMPIKKEMLEIATFVKEVNPYFILTIGGENLTADLCSDFCPTLALATVPSALTVTGGQFQALGRKLNPQDREILESFHISEEHVIEGIFTSSLKQQEHHYSREELGIPKDCFVCIVVGGRLDAELDDTLIRKLLHETDDRIRIAIAGRYESYGRQSKCVKGFADKFIYLGFQNDMLAVLECCDLYINPMRTGGGTSAAEALYKGLPVVTLPVGDVALGAGAYFYVENYDEMIKKINQYVSDKELYECDSRLARERAETLFDTSGEFSKIIKEMIERME